MSRFDNFISNALHFPIDVRAEPGRAIVMPKFVVGGMLMVLATTIGWGVPEGPDTSLWWLAGMVIPGTTGFFFAVSAISIAVERSSVQPGTLLHRINVRLMKWLTRTRKWCRSHYRLVAEPQPAERPPASIQQEQLKVRAARYLAGHDHPFQMQSSGTLLFPVQADKVRLLCLLIPSESETGDRVVVLAQYPWQIPESAHSALIVLINSLNARLMHGNVELLAKPGGELQVRYGIESIGPMSDQMIGLAIQRVVQVAEECYPALSAFMAEEADDGDARSGTDATQIPTLH